MKLPNKVFGINTEEAYKRYLDGAKKEPKPKSPIVQTSLKGVDEGDYIYMIEHGIYVAKERSHLDKNWSEAHEALHKENARMLTIKEFRDFLLELVNGNEEFKRIYNEITEVKTPWRGEWLDADFKVVNDRLHINYNHRTVNGDLQPQSSRLLEPYLTVDKTPGISLDDWLSNPTSQGLPRENTQDGDLYYWHPRENRVARFGANSDGAGLNCCGNPRDSYSALGVRAAREKN